jgi:hypothetical protein
MQPPSLLEHRRELPCLGNSWAPLDVLEFTRVSSYGLGFGELRIQAMSSSKREGRGTQRMAGRFAIFLVAPLVPVLCID